MAKQAAAKRTAKKRAAKKSSKKRATLTAGFVTRRGTRTSSPAGRCGYVPACRRADGRYKRTGNPVHKRKGKKRKGVRKSRGPARNKKGQFKAFRSTKGH